MAQGELISGGVGKLGDGPAAAIDCEMHGRVRLQRSSSGVQAPNLLGDESGHTLSLRVRREQGAWPSLTRLTHRGFGPPLAPCGAKRSDAPRGVGTDWTVLVTSSNAFPPLFLE